MKKRTILPVLIIIFTVAMSSCSTGAQTPTPIQTRPSPSNTIISLTNTSIPPTPISTTEPVAERPGHVQLSGTGQLAGYLYRSFLQLPSAMAWGPDGHLYVTDKMGHHVVRVAKDGSMDDLPFWKTVKALREDAPHGIAFDSKGNLYLNNTHAIYRIDTSGNITEFKDSVYGNPVGGLAINANDELYYTDRSYKGNLYRLMPDGQSITVAYNIDFGESLAFGHDGSLYVTQLGPGRILKVDVGTRRYSTFVDNACGFDPCYLAVDSEGDIWVRGIGILRQFSPDGTEKPFIVDGTEYPLTSSVIPRAWHTSAGIAFDDEGNLWIASVQSWLAKLVLQNPGQPEPEFTWEMISTGFFAYSMDIGPEGEIYAMDAASESLLRIDSEGQVEEVIQHGADGQAGISVDPSGKIFLGMPNGVIYTLETDGSTPPYAQLMTRRMIFGKDGALYAIVANPGQPTAVVRTTDGNTVTTIATEIDGISLGNGEAHISPALETGLYVYTEAECNLFFVNFAGKGHLIANLKDLRGNGYYVMAASPVTGDIFFISLGFNNNTVYRISSDGKKIVEIATNIIGDPWAMVVSNDGQWLYVSESGAIDKIPLTP